jgi:FG-GAP-like repeat
LVFVNQKNGQFSTAKVLPFQAISDGFVIGDFNGDGKLDILARMDISTAISTNTYPVILYGGDGQGNFNQAAFAVPGINTSSQFTGGGAQTFAVDVDGDGQKELIFNLFDQLSVFKYDKNTFAWSNTNNYGFNFFTSRTQVITGDLNGDGFGDLVTVGGAQVNLLLGQSNGSFSSQILNLDNSLQSIQYSKIADINADGKSDLILAGVNGVGDRLVAKVYDLSGTGLLEQIGSSLSIAQPIGTQYKFVDLADVNGDGDLDLILKPLSNGNTLGIIDNQSIIVSIAQSNTLTKKYTYDAVFNQLTSVTDELGRKTMYDLDVLTGNILKSTRVVGQLDAGTSGADDVVTSYTILLQAR